MRNFEQLPHVGGVVCANEEEKLKNLFQLIFRLMEQRKRQMEAAKIGSFRAYKEAGYKDLPHILIMVDSSYVIVAFVTKAIVQISDNINPSTWAPDLSIVAPYIP